ncbi:MAG: extracellular solute-binding protein [Microbacteriaceae bacterium]
MIVKRKSTFAIPAITIAALLVAGCSSGDNTPTPTTSAPSDKPVAGVVADGAFDGVVMTFAGDGGSTQDGQYQGAWKPFEDISGATILQESPQTLAKVEAQVQSGNIQWDMTSQGDTTMTIYCGQLFEKLDRTRIDESKVPEGIPQLDCGIPSILYGYVIVYNTDKFGDNGPKTWADFFDTTKFPGKRGISGAAGVPLHLVTGGAIASGYDPSTPFTDAQRDAGMAKLRDLSESGNAVFWTTGAESQQLLESGEVDIAFVWTGRARVAESNGAKLTPVWDKWFLMTDYMGIVKGTKNLDAAYAALNFYLGAEQQAKFTEITSYSPVNVDSKPKLDEVAQKYIVTVPEKMAEGISADSSYWTVQDKFEAAQALWSTFIAGG